MINKTAAFRRAAALLLSALLIIGALSGCAKDPAGSGVSGGDAASSKQEGGPADIMIDIIEDNKEDDLLYTKSLHLNAVDGKGKTLWEYTTSPCLQGELETVEYIGVFGGLVYI